MTIAISVKGRHEQRQLDWSVAFSIPGAAKGTVHPGLAGPIVGVCDSLLLIGGGANFPDKLPWEGGVKAYHRQVYVYKKTKNAEELMDQVELPVDLAYGASWSTADGMVIAGGENREGLSDQTLLLQYRKKGKHLQVKNLLPLPFRLSNAAMTSVGDILYLAGGELEKGVSDQLLALDMRQPEKGWIRQVNLPYPVSHAYLFSLGDAIYLIGGRKRNEGTLSDFYQGVWQYQIKSKKWIAKASLPEALSAGTGLAMGEDEIWIFSGDQGATFKKVERLLSEIAVEEDSEKKRALIDEKNNIQIAHPGFGRKVWAYNSLTDTWRVKEDLPINAPVTTTAVWWGGQVYIPSGEVKAGIRTPLVLKGKLK
ncbi:MULTISPECIES: hypothetical protein [Olivibacter]|uniref:N-acetylneuraminate epimerase n=2 Tax=Olivibacter jilunii TaxID=985016 RepID=A0ABW6B5F6_9SPHI